MLKLISGGQTGADISGVRAAKAKGYATGGILPRGFRTQIGPKPEYALEYGMTEHSSWSYAPRTFENVKNADGTIRIAKYFESAGEALTVPENLHKSGKCEVS